MEHFLMFLLYWSTPLITQKYIIGSTQTNIIMPYVIIFMLIYLISFFLTVFRAVRTCPIDPKEGRSWGIHNGIKLSFFASMFAVIAYLVVGALPFFNAPFLALTFLPNPMDIGDGFYTAIGGLLGYGFGRAFISMC